MPKPNASNEPNPGRRAKARLRSRAGRSTESERAPKRRKSSTVFKLHLKWRIAFLALLMGAIVCAVYGTWASSYDLSSLGVMAQRTMIYDCHGKPFSRLSGEDRIVTPITQVSPNFINALLAREDSRFYKHHGVDPVGIARAIFRNIIHMHAREGASTLTQQLARNSFPLGGKNFHRKLLEAFLAIRIERHLSKQQILESYVNRIFFGSGFWGVETASRAYFGKPSAKLTLSEAAVLAGLIRSPTRFSPFNNLEASVAQRDTVLDRMATLEMITPAQAASAKACEVVVSSLRPPSAEANYAVDLVRQMLSEVLDEDQLAEGGLRIYTSIDPALQKAAETAVDAELTKIEERPGYAHPKRADFGPANGSRTPYLQGAAIVLDNATGGIRAVAGGRNYTESSFNRALLAQRQVGSTFKPFVYSAAYASGAVSPQLGVSDGPIGRGELKCAPHWRPENSDGTFRGVLPAEDGLILSRNTMSARIGDRAGINNVRKLAENSGLGPLPEVPSIFLGSFSSTLKQVTSAYTIFPNGGIRRQPFIIERVEDANGHALYRSAHIETRVLDSAISWMVSTALEKVLQRGTAAGADFHKPAAGKTGTTNECKDAWFVGYTRSLTCGVWVGLDAPAQIMSHGYGATLALPIWCDVMNAAVDARYPTQAFQPPGTYRGTPLRASERPLPDRIFRSFRNLFGG